MSNSEPLRPFLKSVVCAKQIHDNQLNCSSAKAQYSFTHSKRFAGRHLSPTIAVPFYESTRSIGRHTRTCSFGIGNKYDFTNNNKHVPAPNSYMINQMNISANIIAKRGFSFGVSRELMAQSGIFYPSKQGANKPGPGAYSPIIPVSGQTVTFRIKTSKTNNENCIIGPGSYNVSSAFVPSKQIFNSKFQSTKSTKIAPLRDVSSGKHVDCVQNAPDLRCDLSHQINLSGSYFNSKYNNSQCRRFGKSQRDPRTRRVDLPGPGSYQMPSEFGIYVSSRAV